MAYITHSDSSPENNTSYINTGLVGLVPNNPYHPSATTISWPSNYDLFVNKTNDQQVSVSVSDETHAVSEITADSGLYLNHKPRRGTTIAYNSGVAGGAVDTGLTDYNHGVIYFSTLPTAEIVLTYLADPDKYYGEYLTQIQDVLHKLEIWAGAGGTINEGVRTTEILINSTNGKVDSKLPHNIHIADLGKDITFQSDVGDTAGNTINFGNSYDVVTVNAKEFNVFRGTFNDGNAGDPITVTLSDHSGDTVNMSGLVNLSPSGISRNASFSAASVESGLLSGTDRNSGLSDALRVYGNTYIAGDLFTLGDHTVMNTTITSETNLFQQNIQVNGDSNLGNATTDNLYVSGPATFTGKITAKDNIEVTKSISFTDNGGTAVSTVDGLDASYIANRHMYMRPGGAEWCGDSVNICSIGTTVGTGSTIGGYAGNTTHAAAASNKLIDTGVTGQDLFTGTFYYAGRFDDGTWIAEIASGPDIGAKVPVAKWDSTITGWVLSRDLSTNQNSGITYNIYNKYFCEPDFVSAAGSNFTISASSTDLVVADIKGIVKVQNATDNSISFDTTTAGKKYLFASNENSDAPLNSLESNPVWYTKDHNVPSDKAILIAEVNIVGGSLEANSLRAYRPASKFDTTWFKPGDLPAEFSGSANHKKFFHNIGGNYRLGDIRFTVLDGGSGTEPDLDNIAYKHVNDTSGSSYHVQAFNNLSFEMHLQSVSNWTRIIVEVR